MCEYVYVCVNYIDIRKKYFFTQVNALKNKKKELDVFHFNIFSVKVCKMYGNEPKYALSSKPKYLGWPVFIYSKVTIPVMSYVGS